jgi:hypothetical protein
MIPASETAKNLTHSLCERAQRALRFIGATMIAL